MKKVDHYRRPPKDKWKKRDLEDQLKIVHSALQPSKEVYEGLCEVVILIDLFYKYMENQMDKKKVKTAIKAVAKDVKEDKKVVKSMKGATVALKDKMKKKGC